MSSTECALLEMKRPMLAAADASKLRFPLLASPKIDGVRALVVGGKLLSRALKPIRNAYTQALFGTPELEGLDGELVVGEPTAPNLMQATTSGVMSVQGTPDVYFYVFDKWDHSGPFCDRLEAAGRFADRTRVKIVPHSHVEDEFELGAYERVVLELGFEGAMLRSYAGPYKQGRATAKEGYLTKLKRFSDAEAEVIGFEELMHNANEAVISEIGLTKRSTAKAGKIPLGVLGALVCRTPDGVAFNIGSGFTDEQKVAFWARREELLGATVKYKFFAHGVKEAPRHPVFIGFRDREDV